MAANIVTTIKSVSTQDHHFNKLDGPYDSIAITKIQAIVIRFLKKKF